MSCRYFVVTHRIRCPVSVDGIVIGRFDQQRHPVVRWHFHDEAVQIVDGAQWPCR